MLIEQPAGHVTTPIMPARPLCFGSGKRDLPACEYCTYAWNITCKRSHIQMKPDSPDSLRALLRVYARENHELRERVAAMEWLREVEQVHHTVCWTKEAKQEWRVTLAHARKEAGV